MRIIAIGDIHGCRVSLEALADDAAFTPDDTIVTLGDYVDRGPDTRGVIDLLLDWKTRMRLVCLKGNHEVIMLEARESRADLLSWVRPGVGGEETLQSYHAETLDEIPAAHWGFVAAALPYFQTEHHIFVHGGLLPKKGLAAQPDAALYWRRVSKARPHRSGKVVVCGHTPQREGDPLNLGHTICIDTLACGGGWLTALDVTSGIYWQANEDGARRQGDIADLER